MPRPTNADFTDSAVTEGSFKTAHDALNNWLGALLGSVDDYVRLARGTNASRTGATEGGWLRWNTDNLVIDVAMASGLWHKMATSVIDITWALRFDFNQRYLSLFKSSDVAGIATIGVMNNAADIVEVERTQTATIIRCTGISPDPIQFVVNGVRVFSISPTGDVVALGTITQKGAP